MEFSIITSSAPTRKAGPSTELDSLQSAIMCAQVADEYRGDNIVVLDLRELTPIFDFFVIASGNSRRQMHAIAEEVDRRMSETGQRRYGMEGYQESQWILQDYGDIVLHVFSPETREAYDLESLWSDAKQIEWRSDSAEAATSE